MPPRVLVVDDEPAIRELLAEYLRGRGMDVDVESDAERAVERLVQAPPDLVLTDLRLPGRDGIEVVRKAVQADPPIPAVMITGYGTVETAMEAFRAGARDYVIKPFRLRDLHARLVRTLAQATRDRHHAWCGEAMGVLAAAEDSRSPAEAEALLPRLISLLRRCPNADAPTLREAPTGEARPIGNHRWLDGVPDTSEARACVRGVHAALLRFEC